MNATTQTSDTNEEREDDDVGSRDISSKTTTTIANSIAATTPITELELIAKLRLAFGATLQMLEAARDNLVTLGERMDRLHDTSQQCRLALLERQQQQQQQQQGSSQEDAELPSTTVIPSSLPPFARPD